MGLFNFFKGNENKNRVGLTKSDAAVDPAQQEFIEDMISNAERIRAAYNQLFMNAFDYSVSSLKMLDDLLEQFHQNQDDMDDEMKSELIGQAGGYVFEVARRKYGGKYYWYDQMDQPILVTGQPDFEISILAFDKVKLRIENGKEDNIPYYFKGYEERVIGAIKGDKTLIN
jgi:PAS domain-containing protein